MIWFKIMSAVCERFSVTAADICGRSRMQHISYPRQVVMWLARQLTLMSYEQIGRLLGDRDHTSVMFGVRKITERRADPATAVTLDALMAQLESAR